MATFTAQIIVGRPHQNHGGIIPTHYLFLSENSRPAWVLVGQNILNGGQNGDHKIIWIPTVEHMLEDALLMIAIHVSKNEQITGMAKEFCKHIDSNRVELYTDLIESHRDHLYQECREHLKSIKIVVSVFREATIEQQLAVLEQYKMDVEVCAPVFSRLFSPWNGEVRTDGTL